VSAKVCGVEQRATDRTIHSELQWVPTARVSDHRALNLGAGFAGVENAGVAIFSLYCILWAGVQPTLDPYAEAFIAGPLR